jgi:hypothetical protein
MKLPSLIVGAFVVASLSTLSSARAQTSFALDGSVNVGIGKGGEFKDNDYSSWRVGASLARGISKKAGVFAELAVDPTSLTNGDKLNCVPSSRGGCAPAFPKFSGASLLLGAMSGRDRWFEVRGGVGGALLMSDHTYVGGVVSQADVGLFPLRHAGIVLGWRAIIVPRFRHDRLTLGSAVVGLRLR